MLKILWFICALFHSPSLHANEKQTVVLLTGAAGFIGSNFLEYAFQTHPSYHFIVLDALTYAGSLDNISEEIKNSGRFEFFHGSVTDQALVDSVMKRADFVIHFAAESHVSRSIQDDSIFFETDVIGTRTMMQSLQKNKNVQRFIHISTSEVYGTAEANPMNENHPLNPRSPYAAAKAGADRLVYAYCCTFDLPCVIIRPFNNFGHNQHPEKLIPRLITRALQGLPLKIHGDGKQMRDWVHTRDVAKALDKILHVEDFSKLKHQVINLGSGKPVSVLDIANKVSSYFGLPASMIHFVENRPGQVDMQISSVEKSKSLLDWHPEMSLEEGIAEVIEWYRKNESWWKDRSPMSEVLITKNDGLKILQ